MIKAISIVFAFSMILCTARLVSAQPVEKDPVGLLMQYMEEAANPAASHLIIHDVQDRDILSGDPKLLLPKLQTYENNPSADVRCATWKFEWYFAVKGPMDDETRRGIVTRMARACADPDDLVRRAVTKRLARMDREDFTDEAKQAIRNVLTSKNPVLSGGEIIALAGVADMGDQIPRLQAMLVDETKLQKPERYGVSWRARLALARMGSQSDLAQCIKVVQSEGDPVFRTGILLRQLAFTRQQGVISVLREYLESDESLPSVNEGMPGSLVADYVTWIFAQTLEHFPLKDKGTNGYAQEEIDTAKQWMTTQTQFEFRRRIPDWPLP